MLVYAFIYDKREIYLIYIVRVCMYIWYAWDISHLHCTCLYIHNKREIYLIYIVLVYVYIWYAWNISHLHCACLYIHMISVRNISFLLCLFMHIYDKPEIYPIYIVLVYVLQHATISIKHAKDCSKIHIRLLESSTKYKIHQYRIYWFMNMNAHSSFISDAIFWYHSADPSLT